MPKTKFQDSNFHANDGNGDGLSDDLFQYFIGNWENDESSIFNGVS